MTNEFNYEMEALQTDPELFIELVDDYYVPKETAAYAILDGQLYFSHLEEGATIGDYADALFNEYMANYDDEDEDEPTAADFEAAINNGDWIYYHDNNSCNVVFISNF